MPDGDHFLFLIRSSADGTDGLHVGSIKQPDLRHRISNAPSNGTFVPASNGHPGYVLFARDGNLFAQPFNAVNFTSQGEVITVSPVGNDPRIGQGNFSSGPTSIVLGVKGVTRSQLAWFNREGKQLGPAIAEGILGHHQISPDGSRLALRIITNNSSSLFMMEFSRGVLSLVSPVGAAPAWAADSKEIIYSGTGKVFRKKIDENGPGEELFPLKSTFPVLDWSPDGKSLLAAGDLVRLDINPPETKLFEPGTRCRKFSPNGRFIACEVSEQGLTQIVIQSFPDLKNRWQVSSKGGASPVWRRDGKELFYIDGLNKLMSVAVRPNGDGLAFDTPKLLFVFDPVSGGSFDAAPDGQKFLITTPLDSGPEGSELTILTNWRDGLKLKK